MKFFAKSTLSRLFLLASTLILILTLASCFSAGSNTVYSKETLRENIDSEDDYGEDYAWDYFDEWDFPRFSSSRIREVERIYKSEYYKDLPETLDMARETGIYFLDNYYDDIDLSNETEVTDALISSYVAAIGDDYSIFRTPTEYGDYSSNMSGNYVGIGVTVTKNADGLIRVIEVTAKSPAEEAGILPEDIITSVDSSLVSDVGYDKAIDLIRGEAGSFVSIGLLREGKSLTFSVERRAISESSVSYSLSEDGYGYIRISSFKSNTDEQFKAAINYMEREGARGIIYDLRSNTGGYLSSVENMLSYIAPKGMTLVTFSNGYGEDYVSNNPHTISLPTILLCNEYTASAAELFVAGVRDIAKSVGFDAKIVGKNTFGKGIMQNTHILSDGSSLTLTVAYYNPPSGVNYHGVGISPDVSVDIGKTGDAQLDAAKEEIIKLINK